MLRLATIRQTWEAGIGEAGDTVPEERMVKHARMLELQVWSNLREWVEQQPLDAVTKAALFPRLTREIGRIRGKLKEKAA